MARMKCICGNILSNSTNPDIQYEIFSDKEWINLLDRTDEGEKLINIDGSKNHIWKCPVCDRIHVFEDGNDKAIRVYKVEVRNEGDW